MESRSPNFDIISRSSKSSCSRTYLCRQACPISVGAATTWAPTFLAGFDQRGAGKLCGVRGMLSDRERVVPCCRMCSRSCGGLPYCMLRWVFRDGAAGCLCSGPPSCQSRPFDPRLDLESLLWKGHRFD
jgi:hypothetical protein